MFTNNQNNQPYVTTGTTPPIYVPRKAEPKANRLGEKYFNAATKALNHINVLISLKRIFYLHWGLFWLLNGLDKFFNGYLINGENVGWFGVYRDPKMIAYFERLFLPPEMALTFLYGIGIFETMLGIVFLVALLYPTLPKSVRDLAFKASILIFVMFSVGDILFGDRAELWEHGTFMILAIASFRFYLNDDVEPRHAAIGRHDWPIPPLRPPSQISKPNRSLGNNSGAR